MLPTELTVEMLAATDNNGDNPILTLDDSEGELETNELNVKYLD